MNDTEYRRLAGSALQPLLRRIQLPALIVGVVGLIACLLGAFVDPARFFQSYLFAEIFWLDMALGGLGILMIQYMIIGYWGTMIRRILEAMAMTLPLLLALFLPLLPGLSTLYPWMRPEAAQVPKLVAKSAYLNGPFFLIRAAIYFAIWIALAYLLNRWSAQQDRTGDPRLAGRMSALSRPGMILFVLTVNFAAVDWMMSLEPEWYSSVFGVLFLAGQGLAGMALAIISASFLSDRGPLADVVTAERFNDLGNLLLAFVMFWAYINLSQYLIIWSGNLPEEVTWYVQRSQGGWEWLIRTVLALEFAGPLLVLLSRRAKRNFRALTTLAAVILVVHLIEVYWRIMPAFSERLVVSWLDFAAPLGIGGLWIAAYAWLLARKPLVPLHDPRAAQLEEAAANG